MQRRSRAARSPRGFNAPLLNRARGMQIAGRSMRGCRRRPGDCLSDLRMTQATFITATEKKKLAASEDRGEQSRSCAAALPPSTSHHLPSACPEQTKVARRRYRNIEAQARSIAGHQQVYAQLTPGAFEGVSNPMLFPSARRSLWRRPTEVSESVLTSRPDVSGLGSCWESLRATAMACRYPRAIPV